MREFLITKLICSECGNNLQLTYDKPKAHGDHADGEPTGADMLQISVAVEPCSCVTNQLAELRTAIKTLFSPLQVIANGHK